MFIKLTKSDGLPVWLNPEFIMRIEAWKTGSAVAVAGDGDFEVRETPSAVIALCTPPPPPAPAEEPPKPKTRGRRKKTEAPPAEVPPVAESPVATPPAEEPVAVVEEQKPEPAPKEVLEPAPALSAEKLFPDTPDELSTAAAFLKKQRCRSRKRIVNTLKSRDPKISMEEAHRMLEQMEALGFVSIDAQGHAVFN